MVQSLSHGVSPILPYVPCAKPPCVPRTSSVLISEESPLTSAFGPTPTAPLFQYTGQEALGHLDPSDKSEFGRRFRDEYPRRHRFRRNWLSRPPRRSAPPRDFSFRTWRRSGWRFRRTGSESNGSHVSGHPPFTCNQVGGADAGRNVCTKSRATEIDAKTPTSITASPLRTGGSDRGTRPRGRRSARRRLTKARRAHPGFWIDCVLTRRPNPDACPRPFGAHAHVRQHRPSIQQPRLLRLC
jgi:hypothetical protein